MHKTIKVKCCVCNIKIILTPAEDELKIIKEIYQNRLKLLLYIFKSSLCGEYNYPEQRFEEKIDDLIMVSL